MRERGSNEEFKIIMLREKLFKGGRILLQELPSGKKDKVSNIYRLL